MKRMLLVSMMVFTAAAIAACGHSGPTHKGPAGAATEAPDQLPQFAACMRQHGQNVPDPDPNSDAYSVQPPSGPPNPAWQTALRACQRYLPDGGVPQPPTSAELEALRPYAQCMRDHGIDTTDPDPNTGKSKIGGRLAHATREQINNDPRFKAAQEACKDKLPKGQG
jgi:predicted small lipoprotein YifL